MRRSFVLAIVASRISRKRQRHGQKQLELNLLLSFFFPSLDFGERVPSESKASWFKSRAPRSGQVRKLPPPLRYIYCAMRAFQTKHDSFGAEQQTLATSKLRSRQINSIVLFCLRVLAHWLRVGFCIQALLVFTEPLLCVRISANYSNWLAKAGSR